MAILAANADKEPTAIGSVNQGAAMMTDRAQDACNESLAALTESLGLTAKERVDVHTAILTLLRAMSPVSRSRFARVLAGASARMKLFNGS